MPATKSRLGRSLRSLPEAFTGFWFTTTLFLLLGPALMAVFVTVDTLAGEAGVFPRLFISPTAAQTILGTIAGSLVTVAALTSSLTVVTLQLLSTQFTPRALRGFLRSRLSQVVLGSLIGIFLYSLLVAVTVRDPGTFNRPFVPSLSVVVSIGLALVGLVLLVVFIHHLVTSIQVSNLVAGIAAQTRRALAVDVEDVPQLGEPPATAGHLVYAARPGYVRSVDVERAAEIMGERREWVTFRVRPGDFVTRTTPLLELHSGTTVDERLATRLRRTAPVTSEREIGGDPGFGVRQLTDIALRAIAPGVNDPSTAVTCIGYLQDILVTVAARPLSTRSAARCGSGVAVAPRPTFALYVSSMIEIGRYARDARVASALLDALAATAVAARDGAVDAHLDVLAAAAAAVGRQAVLDARTDVDRDQLTVALARVATATGRPLDRAAQPELAAALVRAAETRTGLTADRGVGDREVGDDTPAG